MPNNTLTENISTTETANSEIINDPVDTTSVSAVATCPCATCEICLGTTEETTEVSSGVEVEFVPMDFANNLPVMGKGMLGIFVVIAVIIAATTIMNKIFSGNKK